MSLKVWALIKLFRSMGFTTCLVAEDPLTGGRAILFAHSRELAEALAYRLIADAVLGEVDTVVPKTKQAARPVVTH